MVKYNESVIYKICCKDVNVKEEYVGSTTNLHRRKTCHKSNCNNVNANSYKFHVYNFIREHGNWQNWDLIEVERYNAIDKHDLHKRERYWIETLNSVLNGHIPAHTQKERVHENADDVREYMIKYAENNKVKLKLYKKAYRQKNRQQMIQKDKEYYLMNKEKLCELVKCTCGSEIARCHLTKHNKTQKHIKYLASILPQ